MTITRTKDPADLKPDRLSVDVANGGSANDLAAVMAILQSSSPLSRIRALSVHPELAEHVAALKDEYERIAALPRDDEARELVTMRLLGEITGAEHKATYLKAAPIVIKAMKVKKVRQANAAEARAKKQTSYNWVKIAAYVAKLRAEGWSERELAGLVSAHCKVPAQAFRAWRRKQVHP